VSIPKQLCIFCEHFNWSKEEMWGMGSTQTGPMFEGGDANCAKGHFERKPGEYVPTRPSDDSEWRALIFRGAKCRDYSERKEP
jgi:hypothetical protein